MTITAPMLGLLTRQADAPRQTQPAQATTHVGNVVDVSEVALGGTFAPLFTYLRDTVSEQLEREVIFAPWSPVHVSEALAGDYPAMTGAALVGLGTVVADPGGWVPVEGR